MPFVQDADAAPSGMPRRSKAGAGEAVNFSADQMAQRVARNRVDGEQDHVHQHDDAAEADEQAAIENKGDDGVVPEKAQNNERGVKEITVHILKNEGELRLATVRPLAFAYRTGGRVHEIGAVVSLAVVVAGGAKSQGEDQDQKCGGPGPEVMLRIDQRRVKGSQVRAPGVVGTLKSLPGCINTERA